MVRKETNKSSPVYCLSLSALAAFYASAFLTPVRTLSGIFSFLSLLAACVLCAGVFIPVRRRASGLLFCVLCAMAGSSAGFLCTSSLKNSMQPLVSLAPRESLSGVAVTFLADPVPWGPDLCRAVCAVRSVSGRDSERYSASGTITLLFPRALEKEALPGGIDVTGAISGEGRILFSAGLEAEFYGKFGTWDGGKGEVFYAKALSGQPVFWHGKSDGFRSSLRLSLTRILYDWGDSGGFLLALFSANRDYLDADISAQFKRTGLSHILALSGMHLSLLALVSIQAGKRIGGKRFSIRLSLVAIVFFVWFAGVSPSLNRALIMALFMILMKRLGYEPTLESVLALAAFFQMMASPSDAASLAFMLSYGALWGIALFGNALLASVPARFRLFPAGDLCASVGAQLMTTPVIALSIGTVAPVGIIASCIVGPLSSVFLVAGVALVGVSALLPFTADFCGIVVQTLYRITVFPVRLFDYIPPLSIGSLPATITACAIPILAGYSFRILSRRTRSKGAVDDCFARL
jgi:ComEC/Rec2-related protein